MVWLKGDMDMTSNHFWEKIKGVILFAFGAGILIYILHLTTGLAAEGVEASWLMHFGISFVFFLIIMTVTITLMWVWGKPDDLLFKEFQKQVDKLANPEVGSVTRCTANSVNLGDQILPAFSPNYKNLTPGQSGIIESLQAGVSNLKKVIERLQLIDEQIIFYESEPEKTLKSFICDPKLIGDRKVNIIRMVGTMRGVCGEDTYSLIDHVCEYAKGRFALKPSALPFDEFRMVVPYNPNSDGGDRLYPLCARYFALKMLSSFKLIYPLGGNDVIRIRMRFNGSDCFPSWHMWGENRFVIVPSIGHRDKDILAKAMPIGLAAKSSVTRSIDGNDQEYPMANTLLRLKDYFDDCLFNDGIHTTHLPHIEEWKLVLHTGEIQVMSVLINACGQTIEDDLIKKVSIWLTFVNKTKAVSIPVDQVQILLTAIGELAEIKKD
jgi:hypothetical protein